MKRSYLNGSCKTGSSFLFTLNSNDHKVQSNCCYSLAAKPLESLYMSICDIYDQCGCFISKVECDLLFRASSHVKVILQYCIAHPYCA